MAVVFGLRGGAEFSPLAAICCIQRWRQRGVAFFAISGFLITLISLRRFGSLKQIKLGAFYRIRFARIAPLLGLLLVILSVLHLANFADFRIRPSVSTLPQALFAAVTFQLNWFEAVHGWLPPSWTVLWSLSVEEMFYFFFPLLCIGCSKGRRSWPIFLAILLGLVFFGPFARSPWYTKNEVWAYQSYLGNMDNVALGCLTALLTDRLASSPRFVRSMGPLLLQILGTLLTLFIVFEWPRTMFGWHIFRVFARSATDTTVLGVGVCLVMLGSVLRRKRGSRWTLPIRWLGRYSYEVYLTHEFVVIGVLTAFLRTRREPVGLWIVAVVFLSGGLGYLLARFASEPANRFLRLGEPQVLRLRGSR